MKCTMYKTNKNLSKSKFNYSHKYIHRILNIFQAYFKYAAVQFNTEQKPEY